MAEAAGASGAQSADAADAEWDQALYEDAIAAGVAMRDGDLSLARKLGLLPSKRRPKAAVARFAKQAAEVARSGGSCATVGDETEDEDE